MSKLPPQFCLKLHTGHDRVHLQVIRHVKGRGVYDNFSTNTRSAQFLWNLLRRKKGIVGLQTYDSNTRIIQNWRQ